VPKFATPRSNFPSSTKDYYCEECRGYEQRIAQFEFQIQELFGPLLKNYANATANDVFAARSKEKEIGRSLSATHHAYAKHVKETHAEK
jgi:hypothetical protein